MKYVIAYDLGTGGIKTSIFGEDGISRGFSFLPYETSFPKEGFREQRPDDWWDAVKKTTVSVLEKTGISNKDIVSLAVSGHSLGAVPVGYGGELLAEYVPIWNDSRATKQKEKFFEKVSEEEWYLSTGNGFPPELYSIFKILWYKDNDPALYEKTDKFIGTKDYVNFRMTGRLATDVSYASGSGVYSLKNGSYNDEYIKASGICKSKLPEILKSADTLGTLIPEAAAELGLSPETLVCAGGVDNACMALGAGCIGEGDVYTSLGTSAWIAVCSEKPVVEIKTRPYVFAHCIENKYVSAEAIFSAGNSLKWVRDNLFFDLYEKELAGGEPSYRAIDELAKTSPPGANKLFFVPTLAGGSSLDESPLAKGLFVGLDLMHTRNDIARAALEGISIDLNVALEALKKHVSVGENMLIVGGGANSPVWRQIFADVYGMNIVTARIGQDAGSFGAAALAAVGAGIWDGYDRIKAVFSDEKLTYPNDDLTEYYNSLIPAYKELLGISSRVGEMLKTV